MGGEPKAVVHEQRHVQTAPEPARNPFKALGQKQVKSGYAYMSEPYGPYEDENRCTKLNLPGKAGFRVMDPVIGVGTADKAPFYTTNVPKKVFDDKEIYIDRRGFSDYNNEEAGKGRDP